MLNFCRFLFVAALWLTAMLPAVATSKPAEVMLFQGGQEADGSYSLGLEIRLAPGWMTYWRKPGEAGIAPQFKTDQSENLKSFEVLFPAPKIFHEGGYATLGYENRVIFPLRIAPKDFAKPVTLRMSVDFGVCEKICLPQSYIFNDVLSKAANAAQRPLIIKAVKELPKRDDAALSEATIKNAETVSVSFSLKGKRQDSFALMELTGDETVYMATQKENAAAFTFILPKMPAEPLHARITVVDVTKAFYAEKILNFRYLTKKQGE
ncbi:MAG: protein-disulfide reductase DsbD domain-containing protein [Pseudomonadota bacterium]